MIGLGFGDAVSVYSRRDHKSSRMPLKTGCRTLPSADLARYLDLRKQRWLNPYAPVRNLLAVRLLFADQRLEPRLQILGGYLVEAVVDLATERGIKLLSIGSFRLLALTEHESERKAFAPEPAFLGIATALSFSPPRLRLAARIADCEFRTEMQD
jgi:hypothetical protein